MSIESITGDKNGARKRAMKADKEMMSLETASAALDLAAEIMKGTKEQKKKALAKVDPDLSKEWELRDRLMTMAQVEELLNTMQYSMESINDICDEYDDGVIIPEKDLREIRRWLKIARRMNDDHHERMRVGMTEVIQ